MKRILALLSIIATANVFAVEKQQLMSLITEASIKRESAYVEVRDRIVNLGTNVLPLLADFAMEESLSWQQRLVARICYERIERKETIEKLLATDWYKHPKINPDWPPLIIGSDPYIAELVNADVKEAGVWYYCLELEWKMTGEKGNLREGGRGYSYWTSACTSAVKDNPEERVWFLRVCADLMAMSPAPPRVGWLRSTLGREKWAGDFQSFPIPKPDAAFLLEHHAPSPVTEEPPFRLGTNIIKRVKQP